MTQVYELTGLEPQAAEKSLAPAEKSLDYVTWHARLRGHNDGGTSSWPIPFWRIVQLPAAGAESDVQQAA